MKHNIEFQEETNQRGGVILTVSLNGNVWFCFRSIGVRDVAWKTHCGTYSFKSTEELKIFFSTKWRPRGAGVALPKMEMDRKSFSMSRGRGIHADKLG